MDNMQIAGYAFDQQLFLIWVQKLAVAAVILLATWGLARAAKWTFARMVDQIPLFRRHTSGG